MKKLFPLILLCCVSVLSAQTIKPCVWKEIDNLLNEGYYGSAHTQCEKLLNEARLKGDGYDILKATYKLCEADEYYNEATFKNSIEAYQSVMPLLQKAEKSMAYLLLGNSFDVYYGANHYRADEGHPLPTIETLCTASYDEIEQQWTKDCFVRAKQLCYEAALTESEALKGICTESYDLLFKGDERSLRLRPTLYDVVMHAVIDELSPSNEERLVLYKLDSNLLLGSAEAFMSLDLPQDSTSHFLWQLNKLKEFTRHHQHTADAAVRAHIDIRRVEKLGNIRHNPTGVVDGLERLAQSYKNHPNEEAMFLYHLAQRHIPDLQPYSSEETIANSLQQVAKAQQYIERIRSIAPKSEWAELAEALLRRSTLPSATLQAQQTVLPKQASSITLTIRNAGELSYRIIPRHTGETPHNCKRDELLKRMPIRTVTEIKHQYGNPYQYYKVELCIPALAAGEYFLIVTNDEKDEDTQCTAITALSVTNLKLSMLRNTHEARFIGMAIDATTGCAVTRCEVAIMETTDRGTHLIETFTPNERGHFTIPFPTGKHRNIYVRASDGTSQAFYTFGYYDYPNYTNNNAQEEEETTTHFTLLPDRYTYRPGEQMQFTLVAYSHSKGSSQVEGNLPITVSLSNYRQGEIGTLTGTTDEWGHYSGSFAIPTHVTPGRFTLKVESKGGDTGSHTINVEAFKAPTFRVALERPATTLTLGDSIALVGMATAYSGTPITGAKVRYEVSVAAAHLFDADYSRETLPGVVVDSTLTEAKGTFRIPINIHKPYEAQRNATYGYTITAHVTDINGETHSARTRFIVGRRTKHARFTMPAFATHGDSIGYSLYTLNDARLAERVTVRLSKLSAPHSNHILAYNNNDYEKWDEECVLIQRDEQTTTDGANHIVLTDEIPAGTYRLTITYTDEEESYSEMKHFTLWSEGKGTVSSHILFLASSENMTVQTGDTALLYIGTRHEDVHIHYYICADNHTVDIGTITLNDETSTLRIPIREEWHDRMVVYLVSVKDNVECVRWENFYIENRCDQLNLHISTLRDAIEPGEPEQCTISISDYYGHPVQAALTLSIYDAALDKYGENVWEVVKAPIPWRGWDTSIKIEKQSLQAASYTPSFSMPSASEVEHYALPARPVWTIYACRSDMSLSRKNAAGDTAEVQDHPRMNDARENAEPKLHLRENLSHTALFLPTLHTDEQGQATFTLTAPDLFSEWHVKGIAHTKEMLHGQVERQFVTNKMLMVQPHVPRFLYEGDSCCFTAKVSNNSTTPVEAKVMLSINDESYAQTVGIPGEGSTALAFPIVVPHGRTSLSYRITAQTKQHSDGEQGRIDILPRRTLVTETMALYTNGTEKHEFVFDRLRSNSSETLEHHSLKLDIASNPIWYAIEALPPLAEEENPSNERLFHRYYATAMSQYLIDHAPEVESQCDLFHRDSLSTMQHDLLGKLHQAQSADGGWPWMEGFNSDRYTTLLIIKGLGELKAMGGIHIERDDSLAAMARRGINYLDLIYQKEFEAMEKKNCKLYSYQLYYLYARSFFPEIAFGSIRRTAYKHYTKLLAKEKATYGTLMHKALRMLTLTRMGKHNKAKEIAKVVRESALSSDEMGIYWRDNTRGWGWDSNATATQAMLIEAFAQLKQPADIIARMQQWLLKQEQTTQWGSSITTAQAIHALIATAPSSLAEECDMEVTVAEKKVEHTSDGRLGIIRQAWTPKEIAPSLAKISLKKHTNTPSWGAMTWQYYEEADKVEASGTGLSLSATYYKVEPTAQGEQLTRLTTDMPLTQGDRVRVRLKVVADRAMDYVELHMKRPAALEPVSTRSGYTYSRGHSYYRSIENTKTTLYFYHIDKGSFFIDCDLWVAQKGSYSCGVSTIQCMYAPEFIATAESTRMQVGE